MSVFFSPARRVFALCTAISLATLSMAAAATAQASADCSKLPAHYRIVILAAPGFNGVAAGINDRGDVVGAGTAANGTTQPFLWSNGRATALGVLDPVETYGVAVSVNDRGQVVGYSTVHGGRAYHAFLWQHGHMTDLGTLKLSGSTSTNSYATAINDRGQVVGYSAGFNGEERAFLWQNGHMTDLGTPSAGYSAAFDINARGHVVGAMTVPGSSHAFLMTHHTFTDLGVPHPPLTYSVALAVNNEDWAVGQAGNSSGASTALLWHNGTMTEISALYTAFAINDHGVVLGSGASLAELWYRGSVIDLTKRGITGSAHSTPHVLGMNNSGELVGYLAHDNDTSSPVLFLPSDH